MNIGLDVGYSATKAVAGERRVTFPSVVGTPDKARFSLSSNHALVLTTPRHVQGGAGAVSQSRFVNRREDRAWIESDEWTDLALAAFTELSTATGVNLRVVTGLPVAFFEDRTDVRDRLLGEHRAQREGRHAQTLPDLISTVDQRMVYYNTVRRHSTIGYVPPLTFIRRSLAK
jgi:hypothetical protein